MTKKWKLRSLAFFIVIFTIFLFLVIAEFIAKKTEIRDRINLKHDEHQILGWIPKPGDYEINTAEFNTKISINSLTLSDRPFDEMDLELDHRILVLGDSHTFAIGVSTDETWPNKLEKLLFPTGTRGTIYNGGVVGYNVGQYLERFRILNDILKPTHIIVGFSMATDLYDLLPPERGGFIYGGNKERNYFDLDSNGNLITKHHKNIVAETSPGKSRRLNMSQTIRNFLGNFALYKRIKRSKVAMWVAANFQPGGQSLWPGLDTALKIKLSEEDQYRWKLAEEILNQLALETRNQKIPITLVNIPYLAQVYDDVWEWSFGSNSDKYDRWIPSKRLRELSQKIGVDYIDTTNDFVKTTREINQWLHYPNDAHPTVEGHALIAGIVAKHIQSFSQ